MENLLRNLIVWLVAVAGAVGTGVVAHRYLNRDAESASEVSEPKRATKAPKRLAEALDLLQGGQYEALDRRFTELQRIFETKVEAEDQLFAEFELFDARPGMRPLLDGWIAARPESDAAFTARSWYLVKLAWDRRGSGFARDTTDTQQSEFTETLDEAARDSKKALELNPRSAAAYMSMLRQAKGQGAARGCVEAGSKILDAYPRSYRLWRYVVTCLEPRWGGSYEIMGKIAQAGADRSQLNPRLKILLGFPDWARARDLYSEEKYAEALEAFNQALTHGDDEMFLESRFNALMKLNRYDEALVDAEKLQMFPSPERADLEQIALKRYQSWAMDLHRAGKREEAIAAYSKVLDRDPDNSELLFWRGSARGDIGQYAEALEDLRRVMTLEPRRIDAVKQADRVLTMDKKWDEILALWAVYIEKNPNDGEAYLERGGANYQKRDLVAALADAKKACELGKQEGCVWAERVSRGR